MRIRALGDLLAGLAKHSSLGLAVETLHQGSGEIIKSFQH